MNLSERIFEKQILIFMTKEMLHYERISNAGVCLELGSAQAVMNILFPINENTNPEEMEKEITKKVYENYCESMQCIAKF